MQRATRASCVRNTSRRERRAAPHNGTQRAQRPQLGSRPSRPPPHNGGPPPPPLAAPCRPFQTRPVAHAPNTPRFRAAFEPRGARSRTDPCGGGAMPLPGGGTRPSAHLRAPWGGGALAPQGEGGGSDTMRRPLPSPRGAPSRAAREAAPAYTLAGRKRRAALPSAAAARADSRATPAPHAPER